MPNGEEAPVIPKREESRDELVSSLESPHKDDRPSGTREGFGGGGGGNAPQGSLIQKRKGGRKPLYQTTEEKKQRNRRAQAAFRERRTEHIKQLETDKKHLEDRVESMEAGQRKDKDENLMLRYKNSLLERILVEHNINFRSEIRQKGLSYSPAQVPRMPQVPARRSVLQRPSVNTLNANLPRGLGRSNSNTAVGVAPASPTGTVARAFDFRSTVQMPQSPAATIPSRQTPFMGSLQQPGSAASSPANMRRESLHGSWQAGFQTDIHQVPSSFPLDTDSFAGASGSPIVQAQFQDAGTGQQPFPLIGQGHYPSGAPPLGQALGSETSVTAMNHQAGQNQEGLNQDYGMIGDLSGYGSLPENDPLGIDRSMQYPTQFDYMGGQRKQQ